MNEAVIKQIADVLKIDSAKIIEAITGENISLEVPTLHSQEALDKFGANRFNEGKKAMSEIKSKELREKFQIETDSKDLDFIVTAIAEKQIKEMQLKPNDLIETLKADKAKLADQLKSYETSLAEKEQAFKAEILKKDLTNKFMSVIPENIPLSKEQLIVLFNAEHETIIDEEGRTVLKKGNEILKDAYQTPLNPIDYMKSYAEKFIKKDGMAGGDSKGSGTPKFSDMSAYVTFCEQKGLNPDAGDSIKILNANKAENFKY